MVKHKRDVDQRIEVTTPPSARNAALFVAEESGLARNATNGATSSGLAKRCKSELDLLLRRQKRKAPDLSQVSVKSSIGFIHVLNVFAGLNRPLLRA